MSVDNATSGNAFRLMLVRHNSSGNVGATISITDILKNTTSGVVSVTSSYKNQLKPY